MRIPLRVRLFSLLAMITLGTTSILPGARAQDSTTSSQIWVTVTSVPVVQYPRWKGIRTDAPEQWKPNAPWQAVASHVQVAKLIAGNIENTRAADLRAIIDEVRSRHMDLALEIGPLVRSDDCASKTESYGKPAETEAILQKIRGEGGDLRYVAMDEPFFYGHSDTGGCHLSAAELARQVAASVTSMRHIFPKLRIGDIEVVGAEREWVSELAQWADAYRAAVGEPLAFLHADVGWSELAMRNLVPLAAELKQRHLPFGIIYNADGGVSSDLEWTQSAVRHFVEIESVLNVHPDAAIFQTWTPYPTNVLPENKPGTLMNVALQYLQAASSIHLANSGTEITGTLTGASGAPTANADVTLTAVDVGARLWPTLRHLSGIVPAGATTGVIGIRVGMEGSCVCAGTTGVIVGGIHYKEQGSGKPPQDVSPVTLPIKDAPVSVHTLELVPGKTYSPNLRQFTVTPGAPYTLDTWIAATAAAEGAGYVTIVFLDAAGKGVLRENHWFKPSTETLGTVETDAHGAFRLALAENMALAQPEIRASYPGSASTRPGFAILPSVLGVQTASLPALQQILPPKPSPMLSLGPYQSELQAIFGSATSSTAQLPAWEQVSRHIQMVRIPAKYILAMPDEALAHMARDFNARHIALGVEILATNWYHEPACGAGLEGYIDPGSVNQVVAKVLRNGGTINLIAMDEPLWFGHFYSGKNACRSSIPDLASRVAVIVKIYTAAFPKVIVGDIEPFPAVSSQPNWRTDYTAWVKAFQAATGSPLSFLHLDFDWWHPLLNSGAAHNVQSPPAIATLAGQVAAVAHQNGLQLGMIMNGGGPPAAHSDTDWIKQAQAHIRALRGSGVHFDHVLFETWDKYPTRSLPASDPNTIGSLIAFYTTP